MRHFPEIQLSAAASRVLGCLLEKQTVTPDHYPLTVNSLLAACNQRTSRHPVTDYSAADIERALSELSEEYLVSKHLGGRTPKWEHNLPDVLALTDAEQAILTTLMLRGTQTAGELKQRTDRMHVFDSLAEVEEVLAGFIDYPHGPLVERLPAGGGRRVETFRHLLGGDGDAEPPSAESETTDWRQSIEQRLADLEAEVARLRGES